nr:phenylalanine--tRNA ligase subunit beta [Clostridia bacterium]
MKIPVSWLNDFVKVDDLEIKVLEEKLVSIGFEIEEVINLRNNIQNVVIGQVVSIEKMENTNHLNICSINIGSDILTIITGAQNVKKGDKVPVAKIGAILPGDKHISLSKLAGKDSYGMLCSGTELNLTEDDFIGAGVNGIWILPPDSFIGQDINDFLGINDYVLDIAITANRPDCNSVLGIAREVAACLNRPLIEPDLSYEVSNIKNINSILQVNNNNYKLCPRYMAAGVIDCKQVISPKIIRDRLKAVNIRPINNLVDITNYVLIEIGQPMHAFDYSNLEKQTIIIRNATKDEEITCLDGNIYKLSDENLVICDGIKPVAIAGIMGGEYSSILESTKDVILESAKFERSQIRHTARNINLHSDSSARFEKGIDYLSQEIGLKRALHLFYKYKWGTIINGIIDKKDIELNMKTISFTNKDITKILGIEISNESIINILNNLQIKTIESNNSLLSTIPLFREDIISI